MVNEPMAWNLLVEELIDALREAQPRAIVGLRLSPEQRAEIAAIPPELGTTSFNLRLADPESVGRPVFGLTIHEPTPDEVKSRRKHA